MSATAAELLEKIRVGVEDLLAPNSRVLYENIFSTRHIGRVLDFMLHESRGFIDACADPGVSEHRVRHAIESAIFNGWANFRKAQNARCLEIEFGWDSDKLVFSVASSVEPGLSGLSDPKAERIAKMVAQIQSLCDGVIVRHHPESGRFTLIGFLTRSEAALVSADSLQYQKLDANDPSLKKPEPSGVAETPQPLASADVNAFLKEENQEKSSLVNDAVNAGLANSAAASIVNDAVNAGLANSAAASMSIASGEKQAADGAVASLDGAQAEEGSVVVGDATTESSGEAKLKAGGAAKTGGLELEKQNETIRVSGAKLDAGAGEDKIVVKGGPSAAEEDDVRKVKRLQLSDGKIDDELLKAAAATGSDNDGDELGETQESMNVLMNTVKAELLPLCPTLDNAQFQEAFRNLEQKIRENYTQTLHHLMRVKNIQNIAKGKHYKDQISLLTSRIETLKGEKQDLINALAQADPSHADYLKLTEEVREEGHETAAKASGSSKDDVVAQSEMRFKTIMGEYQKALTDGKLTGAGSKDWANNFMQDMMKDRAALNQRMREVEGTVKKNEIELKTKETMFKEQMRIKDEQLRQKEFSLLKTKESLADLLQTLEKSKAAASLGSADKNELVGKLSTAERLLSVAKDNNERMQKRVDDIQKKWQDEFNTRASLQEEISKQKRRLDEMQRKLGDGSANPAVSLEISKVKEQRDRALKQIEEVKRQNREIQEKLAQSVAMLRSGNSSADSGKRAVSSGPESAESKHKLDQANKMIKSLKDELEKSRRRFDEIKLEETKLRIEVGRLQTQLKMAGKMSPTAAPPPASKGSSGGISRPLQSPKSGTAKAAAPATKAPGSGSKPKA